MNAGPTKRLELAGVLLLLMLVTACQPTTAPGPELRALLGPAPHPQRLRGSALQSPRDSVRRREPAQPYHDDSLGLEYRYRPDSALSYTVEYFLQQQRVVSIVLNVYPAGEAENRRLMNQLYEWLVQQLGPPAYAQTADYRWVPTSSGPCWYLRMHPAKRSLTLNLVVCSTGPSTPLP